MKGDEAGYETWFKKAENDRLNIENNLAAQSIPWDTVCFHAQQVAEKVLKALLVRHDQEPQRTHDLIALLARCAALIPKLAELEADCRDLTYYAVAVRYPDALYEPTEEEDRRMVAAAHRIYEQVVEVVNTKES